jgi:hypothetical protein
MDKTILDVADGKPAHTGTNPDTSDIHEVKSVLGQYLHDSDRPEEQKRRLRVQLHAATTRESLLDLWREITGQQI